MLSPVVQPNTIEHRHALDSLGLSSESLGLIGTRILAAYNQTTPNDASNAPGMYAYLSAVRALRDVLGPIGWGPYRRQNLEMVISPSKQIAIIPSSGDSFTGLDGEEPKTKNPKGNQTRELVVRNRNQGFLFPEMEPPEPALDPDKIPTWFLLYHLDTAMSEMRMELALPINIDIADLRVDQWFKRIKLSAIKFDHTPTLPPEFTPDFDIEIRRKTNG